MLIRSFRLFQFDDARINEGFCEVGDVSDLAKIKIRDYCHWQATILCEDPKGYRTLTDADLCEKLGASVSAEEPNAMLFSSTVFRSSSTAAFAHEGCSFILKVNPEPRAVLFGSACKRGARWLA